jgi:hypothetical protein
MSDARRTARSRHQRHHRSRRALRWIRALGPILLLVAAGLLSAGVVHVVDVSTSAPTARPAQRGPAPAPRRVLDLDQFDSELYRELQKLDEDSRDETSFLPRLAPGDLLRISLATSHLGARYGQATTPFRSEIRANPLFEGPESGRATSRVLFDAPVDRRSWAPEPGTGLLVAMGLGALGRRSIRRF